MGTNAGRCGRTCNALVRHRAVAPCAIHPSIAIRAHSSCQFPPCLHIACPSAEATRFTVVCARACPRIRPAIGRLSPPITASDANAWRKLPIRNGRNVHASHAVMDGESLPVAERLPVHRRASTTNRYGPLYDATLSHDDERPAPAIESKLHAAAPSLPRAAARAVRTTPPAPEHPEFSE